MQPSIYKMQHFGQEITLCNIRWQRNLKLQFVCNHKENNGVCSYSFQKLESSGNPVPIVIKGGKRLASDQTTAAFGLVSVSGKCEDYVKG